ncbi:DUF1648 domain-containing protein [Streptomyces gibsoniae]|uniref:DUF1648 domain-containing protein n=1 Tax=Streptomyces gibsoniae TaxID=3075529 RepID=A0ABU2TP97_9ACTN|nr:DUF1648 domain-containing protein [Streptomyces sp. DSM 41699]MDT0462661.1 DUF1648 domain-containing protein [Streptomyces sp. DSM 41699]
MIAALPWAARGRLPARLATHWNAGRTPDSSMPLWAASVFPTLIWVVLVAAVMITLRGRGDAVRVATRPWITTALLSGGVLLCGAQASVVRSNLDREDRHEAHLPIAWLVGTLLATVAAGVVGWLVSVRRQTAAGTAEPGRPEGPAMEIPAGQRLVWFSRTVNPWLQLLAAVTGLVAVGALVALAGGLASPGPSWAVFAPCALTSLALAGCAAVRASVSEAGLEVAFGPLGWPVRRWPAAAIRSAHAEDRTPSQVGGWGYRLNGLGTTVMLRSGECLVIRTRDKGKEFAVSVDDAERGAALLNALNAPQAG